MRNSWVLARHLLRCSTNPNPCAALAHPCNSLQTLTLTSVPVSPSSLPPNLDFLQHRSRRFSSSSDYPDWTWNKFWHMHVPWEDRRLFVDESLPAIILFTTYYEAISHVTSDMFMEMCEPFPHVTAYEFILDPEEDKYKSILENLNIPGTPTFHFYQNGKKVAEITRKSWESDAYKICLKKTLVELYIRRPTERSSDKEKSTVEDTLRYRKIT